jgi:acetyl/propionyl-CoA carboxylase alpha subunit
LVDEHGKAVHLGERECSMQRRHQKIIEETPSTIMDTAMRHEMGECAKRIALASGYSNAGTVEFMVDKDKHFYFLEVNTRLQVEHPITEMRTGIDLVAEQLKIASGEKLSFNQEDIKFTGAAIECRICAEDPDNNFMPSIGRLNYISKVLGNGIREDSGIEQGNEISIFYDSMISKLISYGATRNIAIDKMKRALRDYKIQGVKTNISFLLSLLEDEAFISGDYDTQYVERKFLPDLKNKKISVNEELELAVAMAAIAVKHGKDSGSNQGNLIQKSTDSNKWSAKKFRSFR